MNNKTRGMRHRKGEQGVILLLVVLLVVVFSGLGLLAMRYTRGELRSAGAFMDSTQAAAAAEAAILMIATDLRKNWIEENDEATCPTLKAQFTLEIFEAVAEDKMVDLDIAVGFSDAFNQQGDCSHAGGVPFGFLQGHEDAPLAITGGPLDSGYANVELTFSEPIEAPVPEGNVIEGLEETMIWYYFTVTSVAHYGPHADIGTEANPAPAVTRGRAVVRADMMIGPLSKI